MFVYKLSGCGFESRCCHLNFRYRACFEQKVPWHSGNSRVWTHSETCTWHDKNIKSTIFLPISIEWKVWSWSYIFQISSIISFQKVCPDLRQTSQWNKRLVVKKTLPYSLRIFFQACGNFFLKTFLAACPIHAAFHNLLLFTRKSNSETAVYQFSFKISELN